MANTIEILMQEMVKMLGKIAIQHSGTLLFFSGLSLVKAPGLEFSASTQLFNIPAHFYFFQASHWLKHQG